MIDATLLTMLGLGLVLGLRHALDPDHVAAVSTIVSESKSVRRSSLIGTFWGLGHTVALLLVGIFVIALKFQISPRLALWMEFIVALMLILLGGRSLLKSLRDYKVHVHRHAHDGTEHIHVHLHLMSALISLPFVLTGKRFSLLSQALQMMVGLFSLSFGLFLVWQYGFRDGLLF